MTIVEWWKNREPRERLLVQIAAALSAVIILYQGIWSPSNTFKSKAFDRHSAALSEQAEIRQGLRRLESAAPGTISQPSGPVQSIVVDTSDVFGLSISRIQPDENGNLTLWLEQVDPRSFFAWLTDMENNHGVIVEKASVRREQGTSSISANVFVRGRGR